MSKILKYILLSSVILFAGLAQAQQPQNNSLANAKTTIQSKKDTTTIPVWQGINIEIDIEPFIENAFTNNSTRNVYSYQGNVQANLKNSYLPVVEIGMGGATRNLTNNTTFRGEGMFGKLGVDFNLLKPKPGTKINNNYFLAGARIGMSQFNYTTDNLTIEDNYWGGTETINYSMPATKIWFEIVAGVRVEFFKNLYLGWNVRNKHLLNNGKYGAVTPWYIPGYGRGETSAWGFSYTVGYHF